MWRRRCLSWPGARAADEGLANIEFRSGDATRTGLPGGGFDAVVCVFGGVLRRRYDGVPAGNFGAWSGRAGWWR
jgi:hypothetical protein